MILYFYPKDNTSGCTLEAKAFRDHLADFKALGYAVIGVSRDSVKKHCNFRDKNELNFPLLSDGEEKVVNLYGVLKEKSMYGRKYMGIERSTFIIDEEGNLVKEYRKVKASSHVEDLLKELGNKERAVKSMVSQLFYFVFMNTPALPAGRYLPAMVSPVPRTRILRFA